MINRVLMTGGRCSGGPYSGASATRHPVAERLSPSAGSMSKLPRNHRANTVIAVDTPDAARRKHGSGVAEVLLTLAKPWARRRAASRVGGVTRFYAGRSGAFASGF